MAPLRRAVDSVEEFAEDVMAPKVISISKPNGEVTAWTVDGLRFIRAMKIV